MCQNKSRVSFICLPWVVFVRPKLGHVIGGKPVDTVYLKLQLQVHRYKNTNMLSKKSTGL